MMPETTTDSTYDDNTLFICTIIGLAMIAALAVVMTVLWCYCRYKMISNPATKTDEIESGSTEE
ncbi:hypothetical protein PRIPAC_88277 [Pristionchus pacificus]|uniref:Uncharacterized protein n=1 Tax=Pristionchus pacificus TaxID=54126 RepID=A0A2A6B6M9_PRIPA|nr:hypothetical protein PRIPAC_88277 [Pristionchus pacificus]|eukprot:PDM61532.1 hypothetical protein PRIPAC_50974 [Pristionchus pacificus]